MDSVLRAVQKLIAEPFREHERAVWISCYDMEKLKVEMAVQMGIPLSQAMTPDKTMIRSINNVKVYANEWIKPGRMYLRGDDNPPIPDWTNSAECFTPTLKPTPSANG